MNKRKKRVVRESSSIDIHELTEEGFIEWSKEFLSFSTKKRTNTLERIFGRERTLKRMIKNREDKKQNLDDEISRIQRELSLRTKQIKELSKFLSPKVYLIRSSKNEKYKRIRGKIWLSFGNQKSRWVWVNIGTEEMLKDKTDEELKELGKRMFFQTISK